MAQPEPTDEELNEGVDETEPTAKPTGKPTGNAKAKPTVRARKPVRVPNPGRSQKVILLCVLIATTNNTIANLRSNRNRTPPVRQVIMGLVLAIALLVGSEFAPEIAEAFAILFLIGSLVGPNGQALMDLINKFARSTTQGTYAQIATAPSGGVGINHR